MNPIRTGGPATAPTDQLEPGAPATRPPERREGRGARVARWILAVIFIVAGSAKLAGAEAMENVFTHFGYSHDFMLLVGGLEVAGAIGLIVPRAAVWAALGLSAIMAGAIVSHLRHDPAYMALPAVAVLLGLLFVVSRRARVESPPPSARPPGTRLDSEGRPIDPALAPPPGV